MLKQRQTLCLVQDPGLPLRTSVAHGAKYDLGHLQARLAQARVCQLRHVTYIEDFDALYVFHFFLGHIFVYTARELV